MKNLNLKNVIAAASTLLLGSAAVAQGVCVDFDYFYADINYPPGGKQTDIYSVSLEGENAVLTPIIEDLSFGGHIAYNTENKLLYVVNDANGSIRTLDPITGVISAPVSLASPLSSVTVAAFNSENKLVIGSSSNNQLYLVNLDVTPHTISQFAADNDIEGGDITFTENGLYLASKPDGRLYNVYPGFANPQLGFVEEEVTGIATLSDNQGIIVSSRYNNQFKVYEVGADVTEVAAYNAILNGEAFMLENGDMASGCSESVTSIDGCEDFRTYYIHDAQGGGPDLLFEVSFSNGGASLLQLAELPGGSHLGVGPDGLLYIVKYGNGRLTIFDPVTLSIEGEVQITHNGNNVTAIPAVVVGDDGTVYVGASNDKVYSVDPLTGIATFIANVNVAGGDLVFIGDQLWLANRNQGRFYEVGGSGQFDVAAEEINGVSELPDGNLLIANGNLNGLFEVYEPLTGAATGEVFQTGLALFNGDLASRCFSDDDDIEEPEIGACYATDVIEYVEGLTSNGGAIADNRDNPEEALGEPEGTDQLVFVSLGIGGSLTLGFNGAVQNLDGADLEIVETTFGNPGCGVYPEFADIYVSVDGLDYFLAGTVCKSNNLIDISDAGDFEYIQYVKIVNNDELTTANGDAFDVDGVIAIHNCDSDPEIIDPFCTNETVIVNEDDDIIRLTAMGWIQECSGEFGMRWRIRNGSDQPIQAFYNFAGAPAMQGPFNLEAGEAVYFTSDFFDNNNVARTMRVFVNGNQVQVKAHGGSTTSLAECLPGGCPDDNGQPALQVEAEAQLTTYPNPTTGPSVIEFSSGTSNRVSIEIFDMNGRPVEVLFNQDVQSQEIYRVDFNGSSLPNGIYLVKMTGTEETRIEKIMIAR